MGRKFRANNQTVDPASFEDAIATETSWQPMSVAAANFCTHRLATVNSERIEFFATTGAKLFYGLFLGIGLATALGFTTASLAAGPLTADILIPLIMGGIFTLAGAGMLYSGMTPIVFDYSAGFYWRGRQMPNSFAEQNVAKHFTRLDRIHALQLLSKYHRGNKSSYYSYQLNLVLQDGNRINVLNHGNQKRLRQDAAELAAFLGTPVWDGI